MLRLARVDVFCWLFCFLAFRAVWLAVWRPHTLQRHGEPTSNHDDTTDGRDGTEPTNPSQHKRVQGAGEQRGARGKQPAAEVGMLHEWNSK